MATINFEVFRTHVALNGVSAPTPKWLEVHGAAIEAAKKEMAEAGSTVSRLLDLGGGEQAEIRPI